MSRLHHGGVQLIFELADIKPRMNVKRAAVLIELLACFGSPNLTGAVVDSHPNNAPIGLAELETAPFLAKGVRFSGRARLRFAPHLSVTELMGSDFSCHAPSRVVKKSAEPTRNDDDSY